MAIIPAEEKVFMVSNSTNTTYSGSAALKAMQQWYTMEDVTNTVRPYQVFTALLTQSGGAGESYIYIGNPATIGVTYTITSNDDDLADFTNIGAPNNNIGTNFIATGTTPTSWGTYAELTYYPGAPVVNVLENTIGNIWFTYIDIGLYNINSSGLFTNTKTINTIDQTGNISGTNDQPYYVYCRGGVTNYLELIVLDTGLNGINGYLYDKLIEIRVYN